jgi:phage terminase Nu1 subunit (DNA packaging protein)
MKYISPESMDGMRKLSGLSACSDFTEPSTRISRLTTLGFDALSVVMRHDVDAIRYEVIPRLRKAKLLPDRERLMNILSEAEVRELNLPATDPGRPGVLDDRSSITELMGVYLPDKREVIVYDKMCEIVAAGLDLDVESLKRVVAAHEVAHAVTHLGKDDEEMIWHSFDDAREEDKELFAQIYPLLYFRKVRDRKALSVFRKLADHQDDVYNVWRKYERSEVSEVNDLLMEKRLERAADSDLDSEDEHLGLGFDGMETLVLTRWMEKAQQMNQSAMTAGRIDEKDLDFLRGQIRFCAGTIREDLGPGSPNYFRERHDYLQADLAKLRRSLKKMADSVDVGEL